MAKIIKKTIKVKKNAPQVNEAPIEEIEVEEVKVEEVKELNKSEQFMAQVDRLLESISMFERQTLTRQEIQAIANSVLK